ncbi:hypothetical protein D3C86_1138320 [compost metagenome]
MATMRNCVIASLSGMVTRAMPCASVRRSVRQRISEERSLRGGSCSSRSLGSDIFEAATWGAAAAPGTPRSDSSAGRCCGCAPSSMRRSRRLSSDVAVTALLRLANIARASPQVSLGFSASRAWSTATSVTRALPTGCPPVSRTATSIGTCVRGRALDSAGCTATASFQASGRTVTLTCCVLANGCSVCAPCNGYT